MLENQKKTFPNSLACVHQWNYPVINLGRNEYRNCCKTNASTITPTDLEKVGTELILNSPVERNRRARMLLGEKISSCSSCWITEEKKVWTPRFDVKLEDFASNIQYDEMQFTLNGLLNFDDKVHYLANHPITFSNKVNVLDIILTNTCDMQCMYCSHHYSSKWAAERIKYNEIDAKIMSVELPTANKNYKKIFLDWFRVEGVHIVNSINFIGGEPSLIKDFYEISTEIANVLKEKRTDVVSLSVVTNLNSTEVVFNKFTAHLNTISEPFKEVFLDISIESFEKRAEFIRHGLNWEQWKLNFEKTVQLKMPKVKIAAQMATNILSVSSLPNLLKYFVGIYKKYGVVIYLKQNLVSDPAAHAPMLLTPEFTYFFDKSLKVIEKNFPVFDPILIGNNAVEFNTWKRYGTFLKTIRSSIINHTLVDTEKKLVRDFFNQFNKRRNLDIYKIFPEYKEFLLNCGVTRQRPQSVIEFINSEFNMLKVQLWLHKLKKSVYSGKVFKKFELLLKSFLVTNS